MTYVTQNMWVLHSPYPDGTWRGIEKCMSNPKDGADGPLLFLSEQAAIDFCREHELIDMIQVRCLITVPCVRQAFTVIPPDDYGDYTELESVL